MRQRKIVAAAVVLAVLALGVSVGLKAQGPEYRPPRLAFVDIDHLIENYDRALTVERSLKEQADKIRDEYEQKMRGLKEREADLEVMSKESQLYAEEKQKLATEGFQLQWQRKWAEEKVVREARDEMAAIYREIQDAVERYANQTGLEAVLVVARGDLPGDTVPEIRLQIAVRPVLYCGEHLEITKPILAMLNADSDD